MCFFNVIFPFSKRKIIFGCTTESININGELKEKNIEVFDRPQLILCNDTSIILNYYTVMV